MSIKGEILVVDDDADIRDSLQLILERDGYAVRSAANGSQARDLLAEWQPDLVILDVMMDTDTEGFDVAHELRAGGTLAETPIILLTSFLEKVRETGPEQFQTILGEPWPARWLFEKPIDSAKLLAKIEAILAET